MTKRRYHGLVGIIAMTAGGITLGLALARVDIARVVSLFLAGAWLILGALAWRDSWRDRRQPDRFRTPTAGIYQVLPPPAYVRDQQYPLHHFKIRKKGPQSE